MLKALLPAALLCCSLAATGQQVPDTTYRPPAFAPHYPAGSGPEVWVDEGHHNFHTVGNRYRPFAQVLGLDGYRVAPLSGEFSTHGLAGKKILVIANAVHERNETNWNPPNPSAFTVAEIEAVKAWVSAGGSLFLIADHMPFAGAASHLAMVFGFQCYNGFALDSANRGKSADLFTRQGKGFTPQGLAGLEGVDTIATFTGQAFDIPEGAQAILNMDSRFWVLMPEEPWKFKMSTPRKPAAGKSQGAILPYGKGRVVVWGEAAMFSAQLAGNGKAGMNTDAGRNNWRLLLSLMHWLDGSGG